MFFFNGWFACTHQSVYLKAKSILSSLHPPAFNISFVGGTVASVPIPQIINVCVGKNYVTTQVWIYLVCINIHTDNLHSQSQCLLRLLEFNVTYGIIDILLMSLIS